MNCNECSDLLDYYIESELDAKNLELVETHLAFCADCARSYRKLVEEQDLYGQFLVNVQASPQLWTNLQEQFEKAQRPTFRQPFIYLRKLFLTNYSALNFKPSQFAALLLIIVMLGIAGLLKYKFSGNQKEQNYAALPENSVNANPKPESEVAKADNDADTDSNDKQTSVSQKNPSAAVENRRRKNILPVGISKRINPVEISNTRNTALKKSNDEVVGQAERQYQNAIAVLTRDIKRRSEKSPSDALSQANEVLTDLDRTIENTRRAVREQPQNPVAVQYMTDAYAKKIELLRNVLGK